MGAPTGRAAAARSGVALTAILLSGFASLTYQIVWVRRFAGVLGTTNLAVTLVLAMFLGGLGVGALLAGRSGIRLDARRLARRFLLLEVGAAAFAATLPLYLEGTLAGLRAAAPEGGSVLLTGVAAGLFLFPAAMLMGATLPTLTALARRGDERAGALAEAQTAGWLYAANTAGALLGSVGAARLLIPGLGLTGASLSGIAANLIAGAAVWGWLGRSRRAETRRAGAETTGASGEAPERLRFGAVAALSGFAALASEVGWARLAALLFGPTIYTFACVVAAVILGIAVGSAGAGWLLRRRPGARSWLAFAQLGAAAASAVVLALASGLVLPVGGLIARHAGDVPHLLDLQFLAVAAMLLFPAAALGATFPLAVAASGGRGDPAGRATGTIYAWNAGGNVAGALAAGLVLIPLLGIEAALLFAILAHLGAAILARPSSGSRLLWLAAAGLGASGAAAAASWDWELLSGGLYKAAPGLEAARHRDFLRRGQLRFLDQGAGVTVSVKEVAGELSLSIDGKVDATDGADMLTQRMLAHLPLLLAPRPESVLIVGHGSGVTAGAALEHPVSQVTAVEISPEVARASRLFEAANGSPWDDDRFSLRETDARNFLLLGDASWDVVISEPSNPWMSGVSPLFTVEFFELVRSRLTGGGLFCQWVHLYNLDEESLRTLIGGFTDVFPETALFVLHDADALLVGSRGGFPVLDAADIARRLASLPALADYGLTDVSALRNWLTATTPGLGEWAAGAPRHRDDHPVLEFRAPLFVHAATASGNRRALEGLSAEAGFGPFGPASPPDAGRLAARAGGLLLAANPDWALELAARALELDPGQEAAAEALVRAAVGSGGVADAEAALRGALATGPASGETTGPIRMALARLLLLDGRLDAAAAVLESGPGAFAEDREALLLAAEVQIGRGALDSGEALILAALALDPLDAEAAGWLAELSLRRGNPAEAAGRAAAILDLRPDSVRALRVRAVALAQIAESGGAGVAREAFGELLRRAPGPAIHWGNAAAFERSAGRFSEAVRLYREAVDRDPGNLAAYRGLLDAAARAGDAEQARRAREVLGGR